MPAALAFAITVVAYFGIVWAVLRVFTTWEAKPLLVRAAALACVCNLPLLLGGAVGLVLYILVSVIAMRFLIAAYDATFTAATLSLAAGAIASIGVAMALR